MALVGRLHPLIVHFPIALVMLAAAAEGAAAATGDWRWRTVAVINLRAGAAFAVAAVIAGWRLASAPGVESTPLLEWHRWLGAIAAVVDGRRGDGDIAGRTASSRDLVDLPPGLFCAATCCRRHRTSRRTAGLGRRFPAPVTEERRDTHMMTRKRLDRRHFLQCMAWVGTGAVWTMSGGVLNGSPLGRRSARR